MEKTATEINNARYNMKRTLGLAIPILLLLLAGCSSTADLSQPTSSTPSEKLSARELSQEKINLGKVVYADNCASCHGEKLEGEANWKLQNEDGSFRSPPHDISGHTWHHGDDALVESIELGGARLPDNIGGFSKMPAFEGVLTGEEIAAVLTYIKSTWPEEIRGIQWEQTARERVQ